MINLVRILKYWKHLPKSIYWNFKLFPLKEAIRIPLLFNRNCNVRVNGSVYLENGARFASIKIGFTQSEFFDDKMYPSSFVVDDGLCFLSKNINIGCGCKISIGNRGVLHIGENFWSTGPILMICRDEMFFGDNVVLAWGITVMDHNPHPINGRAKKGIRIGDNCWLSFNSTILPGTSILEGTVVSCNATVSKTYDEANIMLGGVNSIINRNITWR